ncbi:hypothetical protein M3Y98_00075000 [Aphelenchoides besseyi]|nr:hypothetical protein M3Y98_00075000 [Aphelenchoides besseyi]
MFTIPSTVLRTQFVVEFVFNFIALLIQISLLYRICVNGLSRQLSGNLLINIIFWLIVSAAGALHTGYMIHFFAFEPYWGPAVLWTGSFYYAALTCLSISILFLLLERIYSLNAPVSFNRNREFLVRLTIGITIGVGLFVQFISPIRESVDQITLCPVFTCLLVRYRGYLMATPRIICCFLNVFLAFVCWRKISA